MPSKEESADLFGFDTTRLFSNSVQSFANERFTVLIFREHASVLESGAAGFGDPEPITRNVASIVLPSDIASNFAAQLIETLTPLLHPNVPQA